MYAEGEVQEGRELPGAYMHRNISIYIPGYPNIALSL